MNFFDHKNLGNHLLQLCPKVVKHSVCIQFYYWSSLYHMYMYVLHWTAHKIHPCCIQYISKISTAKSFVSEPQCSGFTPFMALIFKPLCQTLVTGSEKSEWDCLAHELTSSTIFLLSGSLSAQSSSCIKWSRLLACFMKLYPLSIIQCTLCLKKWLYFTKNKLSYAFWCCFVFFYHWHFIRSWNQTCSSIKNKVQFSWVLYKSQLIMNIKNYLCVCVCVCVYISIFL